jgi:hypothetical protein
MTRLRLRRFDKAAQFSRYAPCAWRALIRPFGVLGMPIQSQAVTMATGTISAGIDHRTFSRRVVKDSKGLERVGRATAHPSRSHLGRRGAARGIAGERDRAPSSPLAGQRSASSVLRCAADPWHRERLYQAALGCRPTSDIGSRRRLRRHHRESDQLLAVQHGNRWKLSCSSDRWIPGTRRSLEHGAPRLNRSSHGADHPRIPLG